MGNDGIIVATSEPEAQGKVTWLKIKPDGSREWYEQVNGTFALIESEAAPVSADHSHPTHGDINFTGTVSSSGEAGIDSPGAGEFEVGQIESIKVRNGLIVAFTQK